MESPAGITWNAWPGSSGICRLVKNAEDYHWSSAAAHMTSTKDDLLQEPSWLDDAAKVSYAEFITNNDEEAENRLRSATRTGRPYGSDAFIDTMETLLNATLRPRKPGRPPK